MCLSARATAGLAGLYVDTMWQMCLSARTAAGLAGLLYVDTVCQIHHTADIDQQQYAFQKCPISPASWVNLLPTPYIVTILLKKKKK
jgi:hypothetical protein